MGNPLFGDWKGIPRGNDAQFVSTPVGERCLVCEELVADGDLGEIMHVMGHDGDEVRPVHRPAHRECMLLCIIGHDFGICRCTNFGGQPSIRAAALELLRVSGEQRYRNMSVEEAVTVLAAAAHDHRATPDTYAAFCAIAQARDAGELSDERVAEILGAVGDAVKPS